MRAFHRAINQVSSSNSDGGDSSDDDDNAGQVSTDGIKISEKGVFFKGFSLVSTKSTQSHVCSHWEITRPTILMKFMQYILYICGQLSAKSNLKKHFPGVSLRVPQNTGGYILWGTGGCMPHWLSTTLKPLDQNYSWKKTFWAFHRHLNHQNRTINGKVMPVWIKRHSISPIK